MQLQRPLPNLSLLTGLALLPVPLSLLSRAAAQGARRIVRRHPELRERLESAEGKSFCLVITDLPFDAWVLITADSLDLKLTGKNDPLPADVRITATAGVFMDLMEGRRDGDALFFARDLTVEGDTEALLSLRNALDNAAIRLSEEIPAILGPLAGPASLLHKPLLAVTHKAARDLTWLQTALAAPLIQRCAEMEARLKQLEKPPHD